MKKFLNLLKLHYSAILLIIGTLSIMIWYVVMYPYAVSHIGLFLGSIMLEFALMLVLYFFENEKGIWFEVAQLFCFPVLAIFISVYGLLFFNRSWLTAFGMLIIASVLFVCVVVIENIVEYNKKHPRKTKKIKHPSPP